MGESAEKWQEKLVGERFEPIEVVGSGAQATTFRARDRESGGEVAVKILEFDQVEEWKSIELFEREISALQNIDHPQIPEYIDASHDLDGAGNQLYLAQEFIEGTDLQTLLDEGRTLDESEALEFLDEMLQILSHLGQFSPPIVHRDIKPSNIMRQPDGQLALIDFGAVRTVLPDTLGGSTFFGAGTTGYMPPEQIHGRAGPAADIYAVAVTTVVLLSGIDPLDMPMKRMKVQIDQFLDVSDAFAAVLNRMLEPDVDQRYSDPDSVLEDLRNEENGTRRIEGGSRLHHLREKPDSIRSRLRATNRELTVDIEPTRGRWVAFVSTLVDVPMALVAAGYPILLYAVWTPLDSRALVSILPGQLLLYAWLIAALKSFSDSTDDIAPLPELPRSPSPLFGSNGYSASIAIALLAPWAPLAVEDKNAELLTELAVTGPHAAPSTTAELYAYGFAGYVLWIVATLLTRRFLYGSLGELKSKKGALILSAPLLLFVCCLIPRMGWIAVGLALFLLLGFVYFQVCRRLYELVAAQFRQFGRLIRPRSERLIVNPDTIRCEFARTSGTDWQESWGFPTSEYQNIEVETETTKSGLRFGSHLLVESEYGLHSFGAGSQYVVGSLRSLDSSAPEEPPVGNGDQWRRELEWLAREIDAYASPRSPRASSKDDGRPG